MSDSHAPVEMIELIAANRKSSESNRGGKMKLKAELEATPSSSSSRIDLTNLANHLYVLIASSYVTCTMIRILDLDDTIGSITIDAVLLLLAILFVADASIYAYVHATTSKTPEAAIGMTRLDQAKSPRKKSLSPTRINVVPNTFDTPLKTGAASSLHACTQFHSTFLSSAAGLAETLNVIGGIGYLVTVLIACSFLSVDETTERTLDRTASIIDNCSMIIVLFDAWLYYYVYRRACEQRMLHEAKTSTAHDDDEHATLIEGTNSIDRRQLDPDTPPRSSCVSGLRDPAFYANVFNILGSSFYLASTLYGLILRMNATEDLAAIHALADTMNVNNTMPGESTLIVADFAAINTSSSSASSVPLVPSALLTIASTQLHAHPQLNAWEAEIESPFHLQLWIALAGDIFYLMCALAVEYAYRQNKCETKGLEVEREEETNVHQDTLPPHSISISSTSSPNLPPRFDAHSLAISDLSVMLPPSSTSPLRHSVSDSSSSTSRHPLVVMDSIADDPTLSITPMSPPSQRR